MVHKTFYLRAPDESSARADIKSILELRGLSLSKVFSLDTEGNIAGWNTVIVSPFAAGRWVSTPAEYDSDGNKTQDRVMGDHFLLTGRTDDEALKEVIKSFAPTDPKTDPTDVPLEDKAPNGLSKINPPSTPIRPILT